jgi:GNAT superfamily N-acetyltransferase
MSAWALKDVARLEELRQARGLSDVADEFQPIAGGTMSRSVAGSWLNSSVGLGFDGPVPDDTAERLIEFFTAKGIEPRIELCPYADPSLTLVLERAGFTLRGFESMFFRELDDAKVRPIVDPPPGLTIEPVDPGSASDVRAYATTAVSGFFPADFVVPEAYIEVAERCARHPRSVAVLARLDGELVSAGAVEISGDVAALFGLSVVESHRRRGVQQAMIAYRVNLARDRGAKLAIIGAKPGIATERNVRRMGFQAAYTKVVLVRPGEGLAPNVE